MTNWFVTLVPTCEPFEMQYAVIPAGTIQEALSEAEQAHPTYYARSARFHSSFHHVGEHS